MSMYLFVVRTSLFLNKKHNYFIHISIYVHCVCNLTDFGLILFLVWYMDTVLLVKTYATDLANLLCEIWWYPVVTILHIA